LFPDLEVQDKRCWGIREDRKYRNNEQTGRKQVKNNNMRDEVNYG
jgi:hypothetical protein